MYIDYTILIIYIKLDNLIFTATLQGIINFFNRYKNRHQNKTRI